MNFKKARYMMVLNQLKPNKITDESILDLFSNIPKENFLPEHIKNLSYIDKEIKIAEKKSYIPNLHIAQMLQSAELTKNDKVLHLGALTGYVTIFLSKKSNNVISLEENIDLFNLLKNNMNINKINNVKEYNYKYENGYELAKPYDVIFIDYIIETIPNILIEQLNSNNGRLITIERNSSNLSKGIKIVKNENNLFKEIIFDFMTESHVLSDNKNNFEF